LSCPACGTAPLDKARVLDFSCAACCEEYQQATKGRIDREPTTELPDQGNGITSTHLRPSPELTDGPPSQMSTLPKSSRHFAV